MRASSVGPVAITNISSAWASRAFASNRSWTDAASAAMVRPSTSGGPASRRVRRGRSPPRRGRGTAGGGRTAWRRWPPGAGRPRARPARRFRRHRRSARSPPRAPRGRPRAGRPCGRRRPPGRRRLRAMNSANTMPTPIWPAKAALSSEVQSTKTSGCEGPAGLAWMSCSGWASPIGALPAASSSQVVRRWKYCGKASEPTERRAPPVARRSPARGRGPGRCGRAPAPPAP